MACRRRLGWKGQLDPAFLYMLCPRAELYFLLQKQVSETRVQVQVIYLGSEPRKHSWWNEKLKQGREDSWCVMCYQAISYWGSWGFGELWEAVWTLHLQVILLEWWGIRAFIHQLLRWLVNGCSFSFPGPADLSHTRAEQTPRIRESPQMEEACRDWRLEVRLVRAQGSDSQLVCH